MRRAFLYRMLVPALKRINKRARRAVSLLHLLQFKVEGLLRPAAAVTGLDANREAIVHAGRVNGVANVRFICADIRRELPAGPFDNVIWDGALIHFSEADVLGIPTDNMRVLAPGGVLSGQTDFKAGIEYSYAKIALPDAESLADLLGQVLPDVFIRHTVDGPRVNFYFFCSDEEEALPFSPHHADVLVRARS